jgi:hypothetical protein
MSDLLTSMGTFMSGTGGKGLTGLLGLAGTGANIFTGIQNAQATSQARAAQNYVNNLIQNPTKMQAAAASYTQPLAAGLTSDIANQVQGNLAERGLGSSPAAYTQQLTSAIAPYIQQNQQLGLNELMSALGIESGQKPITSPTTNITSALQSLMKTGGGTTPTTSSGDPYGALLDANYPSQDELSFLQPTQIQLSDLIPMPAGD